MLWHDRQVVACDTSILYSSSPTPLLIQLPSNVSEKTVENGSGPEKQILPFACETAA